MERGGHAREFRVEPAYVGLALRDRGRDARRRDAVLNGVHEALETEGGLVALAVSGGLTLRLFIPETRERGGERLGDVVDGRLPLEFGLEPG